MTAIDSPATDTDAQEPPVKKSRGVKALNIFLLGTPVLVLIYLAFTNRWMADDGFIHLRVVENIAHGHGPVFNIGDRVEASTSPLWVFLLAPFARLTFVPLEWWAVLLGITGTVAGVLAAQRASLLLGREMFKPKSSLVLPIGTSIFVALPPVWAFTTSGLENGLGFAWQGVCFLLLVNALRTRKLMLVAGAVISVGTLIRPDFGIFWAGYGLCLLLLTGRDWKALAKTATSLVAIPLAYQIFRMGYFASFAPSPALAKEAGLTRFDVGLDYLIDFARPYALIIPLTTVALFIGAQVIRSKTSRLTLLVFLMPIAMGLLHAAYVVKVGGDFMHARMFLPSLFSILLPMFAIPLSVGVVIAGAIVFAWSIACVINLRTPYAHGQGFSPKYIAEERVFWVHLARTMSGKENLDPVTIEDYGSIPYTQRGFKDREAAKNGQREMHGITPEGDAVRVRELRPEVKYKIVSDIGSIGLYSFSAGSDIAITDPHGLSDSIASRVELTERGRPGHEKILIPYWFYARYAAPSDNPEAWPAEEKAAARALACGDLHGIIKATTDPMSVSRFFSNIWNTPKYWTLRVPNDPFEAEKKFCKSSP